MNVKHRGVIVEAQIMVYGMENMVLYGTIP